MPQVNVQQIAAAPPVDRNRALRILAKSIYKELRSQGYESRQIVALASELIDQVTTELGENSARP
ncbi:MAG: hypothetical protein EXR73_06875 [Myxococcales bacterium]|nr:hypothetical protein [Myxococcales bacterium]